MTLPKPPLAPTKLPGGWSKIIQIADDLRARNTDGYLPAIGGILANVKNHQALLCKGTTCSPFTATVIGVAFDPKYPRDDLKGDAYVPLCNGGKDAMKYPDFYHEHNTVNDNAANAVAAWGLGKVIDAEDLRRGDLVEINWNNDHGHAVFCWDVHLGRPGQGGAASRSSAPRRARGRHRREHLGCPASRGSRAEIRGKAGAPAPTRS